MEHPITDNSTNLPEQTPTLVLASSSQYRKMLIERLGLAVQTKAPEIDETALFNESSRALSIRLARQKTEAVAKGLNNRVVIGSDQVAMVNSEDGTEIKLGKPGSRQKAFEQLALCQQKTVVFYTSVCLYNPFTSKYTMHTDTTEVSFRTLTDAQIYRYIDIEKPFDCAGSFKCEGLGIRLFSSIRNEDPTALIGLPLIGLTQLLINAGIDPLN